MNMAIRRSEKFFTWMVIYICCINTVCGTEPTKNAITKSSTTIEPEGSDKLQCWQSADGSSSNAQRYLRCCNETVKVYEKYWNYKAASLAKYLATLKMWKCPQFEEECKRRTFAFNEFTTLMYDRVCSHDNFVENCLPILTSILLSNDREKETIHKSSAVQIPTKQEVSSLKRLATINNTSRLLHDWFNVTSRLTEVQLNPNDLTEPCLQVALYKEGSEYHEFKVVEVPTCDLSWCGFDEKTVVKYQISAWTCMPSKCRINLWIIRAVFFVLGLAITILNLLIILVLSVYPSMIHSQSTYKLSLAFADLLMGVIGCPTFIVTLWMTTNEVRSTVSHDLSLNDYSNNDGNWLKENTVPFYKIRRYPAPYLNFMGFITCISITVSVYTLAVSGFDRLFAVYKPLSYRKDVAKSFAKKVSIAIWILAAFFCLLPIFVPSLKYFVVLSFFGAMAGRHALIVYAAAGALPLLVMWIVNIATYCFTKKHARVRKRMTTFDSRSKAQRVEYQLAKTLGMMVGAFTACVSPALVILLAASFIPEIYPNAPKRYNPKIGAAYYGVEFVAFVILMCNSLCNFFVYSGRNLNFRKAVKKMLRTALKRSGVQTCLDSFGLCCRSVAYHGRRRLSSFPTLPGISTRKRSSASEPTGVTGTSNSSRVISDTSAQDWMPDNADTAKATSVQHSSKNNYSSKHTKISMHRESQLSTCTKVKSQSYVQNDSVFNSFVIDAHADRFFVSVMDNIVEEDAANTDA